MLFGRTSDSSNGCLISSLVVLKIDLQQSANPAPHHEWNMSVNGYQDLGLDSGDWRWSMIIIPHGRWDIGNIAIGNSMAYHICMNTLNANL